MVSLNPHCSFIQEMSDKQLPAIIMGNGDIKINKMVETIKSQFPTVLTSCVGRNTDKNQAWRSRGPFLLGRPRRLVREADYGLGLEDETR